MKSLLLTRLLLFLTLICSALPAEAQSSGQATLFVYHHFGDPRYPSTNISLKQFGQHLDLLRQESAHVISLGELVTLLEAGHELPHRTVVLTVDDAYQTFLTGAMPLLREFGYPITLFVSTDAIGGTNFLNWDQLRRLRDEGVEIGNHSATHAYLLDRLPNETDQAWRLRTRTDLERARNTLKRELGAESGLLAYPYGEYDPALVSLARELGFRAAVGQQSGVVAAGDDLFGLARFPVAGPYAEPSGFRDKLRMRPLPVKVIEPDSPVIDQDSNPPILKIKVALNGLDPQSLKCYVSGQGEVALRAIAGTREIFEIQAVSPLQGRRAKYTITARDRDSGRWYWFSQLWIFANR